MFKDLMKISKKHHKALSLASNRFSACIVLLLVEMHNKQKVFFQISKLIKSYKLMKKIKRKKLKKFKKSKENYYKNTMI